MLNNIREFITHCYSNIIHREPAELKQIQRKKKELDINYFEKKVYSQNGEDGIIEFIFNTIGTTNRFFVEFGVQDGMNCNTRYLLDMKGWNGLMMEADDHGKPHIKKEFVTAENINDLFEKYLVPHYFDLLSIDIDFNDYWVWNAIKTYHPRVVIIEYNATFPHTESKVVEYNPKSNWDGTNYFGASLLALVKLGKSKGYTLIGCDSNGVNAFFIKNELFNEKKIKKRTIQELYRPPKYGQVINGEYTGHPPSNRKMIEI